MTNKIITLRSKHQPDYVLADVEVAEDWPSFWSVTIAGANETNAFYKDDWELVTDVPQWIDVPVDDVKPGDEVTIVPTGEPWDSEKHSGSEFMLIEYEAHGLMDTAARITRVRRQVPPPMPPLPTEWGSIIVNATIRGVEGQRAVLVNYADGKWWHSAKLVAATRLHGPENITYWELPE